ncbi:MAG: NAD(P)H-dependent glycerol-3-phosphate dehydrogenase [Gaiellaceae bacterium]
MRVALVGAGAWGTAFAGLLAERGHAVTLVTELPEQARAIAATGHNPDFLSGLALEGVAAVPAADSGAVVEGAELVVLAVPSAVFSGVAASLPGRAPVLSLAKGLDPVSGRRLSTLLEGRPVAVLSGPNFAHEIAAGLPAAAVVASEDEWLGRRLQTEIGSLRFRVYVNDDVAGVELCGAANNVIARAAGVVDGLELGDNAKASLMTRGLAEMIRLGLACGARADTFAGLAGMGDLLVTCWHRQGRNRRAGELMAQGASAERAAAEIGTVEGLTTAPVLSRLAHELDVELPITDAVCTLIEGADDQSLADSLMGRRPTEEYGPARAPQG